MAREPTHVAQSQRPGSMTIGRQRCPFHCQLRVMILALRFCLLVSVAATGGSTSVARTTRARPDCSLWGLIGSLPKRAQQRDQQRT